MKIYIFHERLHPVSFQFYAKANAGVQLEDNQQSVGENINEGSLLR